MAAVPHTKSTVTDASRRASWVVVWTPLTSTNNVGDAYDMSAWSDRTAQVTGTFGSATLIMQGSNDGTNWFPLNNLQGTAWSIAAAAGGKGIAEVARYMRPSTSGGDGTQSLTVTMLATGYKGN